MDYSNDPELNGKYLGTITKDFATVSDTLLEASAQIRQRSDILLRQTQLL